MGTARRYESHHEKSFDNFLVRTEPNGLVLDIAILGIAMIEAQTFSKKTFEAISRVLSPNIYIYISVTILTLVHAILR